MTIVPAVGLAQTAALACRAARDPHVADAGWRPGPRTNLVPATTAGVDCPDAVLDDSAAIREVVRRGLAAPVTLHAVPVLHIGGGRSFDRGAGAGLPSSHDARPSNLTLCI